MELNAAEQRKKQNLFLILGSFFLANAIIAEFIGVKIFSVEKTFGFSPVDMTLFGIEHLSFNMTCGVILWPFVFIMTDIINEYFGHKGVRFFSALAAILIAYAFFGIYSSIKVQPADWWIIRESDGTTINMDQSFNAIFGQGLNIIIASITAFIIGQLVDVYIFQWIKKITGPKHIWLRSTGSTLISQLIDTIVVLYIAFVLPGYMTTQQFLAIATVTYIYKFSIAILTTPILYGVHYLVEKYLGDQLAQRMMLEAEKR